MSSSAPVRPLRIVIADDSFAASFQTMGQYRGALLAHVDKPADDSELKRSLCGLLVDNTGVTPLRAASLVDLILTFVRMNTEQPLTE